MAERNILVDGGSDNIRTLASGDTAAKLARSLFAQYTNQTTSGTGAETMYSNSLAANTFISDGGVVTASYAGTYAANARIKHVSLVFASTTIFDSSTFDDVVNNNLSWDVSTRILRVSNTVVRCSSTFNTPNRSGWSKYVEITSLNLTSNAYSLDLQLTTPDASGDATARMGFGTYYPAP